MVPKKVLSSGKACSCKLYLWAFVRPAKFSFFGVTVKTGFQCGLLFDRFPNCVNLNIEKLKESGNIEFRCFVWVLKTPCLKENFDMPLAFNSINMGTIAFGFFNIDSDMLLLEEHFFFASDFCEAMSRLGRLLTPNLELPAYTIHKRENIGDLMGAIRGVRFSGFIGETYKKYPFPQNKSDFKQKTEGFETRKDFEAMILNFADTGKLSVEARLETKRIHIGQYQFEQSVFVELLYYIWQGGYPRWKDEKPPRYVREMESDIAKSDSWVFQGFMC